MKGLQMQKVTTLQKALMHRLFLVLFAMLTAGLAWAGPEDDARAAYLRKDYAEVLKIVKPAALKGEAWAQSGLADTHHDGEGVMQNYVKVHSWFNLSAVSGDEMAIENRDTVAERMTAQQIAKAQKLARDCQARQFKGCD